MYDLTIFIGRFQPFHIEHKKIIDIALEKSKHVLVLVGSAGSPRTPRNPFTFQERKKMIIGSYEPDITGTYDSVSTFEDHSEKLPKLIVKPLFDKTYNDSAWIAQVQNIVKKYSLRIANPDSRMRIFNANGTKDIKVALIGAAKDHTSFYLKLFPQFDSIDVPLKNEMHSTFIREMYFNRKLHRYETENVLLPKSVCDFLFNRTDGYGGNIEGFEETTYFDYISDWMKNCRDYQEGWKAAPYPVKQVTVDAVVEQSGHILLVKRKANPGKGLIALPGGHLDVNERILDGALRELDEETKIKVPEPVLRGSIINQKVYDEPNRSTIGRVITHAFHIKLKDDVKLPRVKGSDDAEKAFWMPIADLKEDKFFDDHFHIINDMLGIE